ncbi:MAG: DUF4367 domain-containing protein [Lachnospiraceae bacterium]|nr:DUF4367 domain-containing protein [Robinsoniella sp.]MDY3766992.1 DUF4367 domain-containing protein [Lachnospiraceae bacterium]
MIIRKGTKKNQKDNQQIDRDDDIGQMLLWSMKEPYEEYEKELNENPETKDLKPSDELFDKIVNSLKEQNEWEKSGESDTFNVYNMLSEEDREALELGKKIKKINKRTIIMKRVAIVACVVLCVFGVSMTSGANRKYVVSVWNGLVGNSQLRIEVNMEDEQNGEVGQASVEEAMEQIRDELGIHPIELGYKPKGMEFSDYRIEKAEKKAILFYKYNEVIFTIYMQKKDSNGKYVQEFDGIVVDEIPSQISSDEIKIWKISDKEENYAAQFERLNDSYIIRGYITEKEFVKIIENIRFSS